MDTIQTYLENMFRAFPQTPEVLRAKEELFGMMEDKYNELKAAGKTENEAIGAVIAEFGNLDELADELNFGQAQRGRASGYSSGDAKDAGTWDGASGYSSGDTQGDGTWDRASGDGFFADRHMVDVDEAEEFLASARQVAGCTALGVLLCILSPMPLIYLDGLAALPDSRLSEGIATFAGLTALFLLAGSAVALFIIGGMKGRAYDYLKKQALLMSPSTFSYIRELNSQFHTAHVIHLTAGILLCIFSVIPLFAVDQLLKGNDFMDIFGLCLMFTMVAVGVYLIVRTGILSGSFSTLLKNTEADGSGSYHQAEAAGMPRQAQGKNGRSGTIWKAFDDIYWPLMTVIYFLYSFYTMRWHISWLIWPLAAVLHSIASSLYSAISGDRQH